jgi:hypothetical protein
MESSPTASDLKRLAAEVSIQHGIRIDPDDPMMAVVTLNRLVFEAAVAKVLERMQAAVRDFEAAGEKVQIRAGGALAQEVRESGVVMRQEVAKLMEEFRRGSGPGRPDIEGRRGLSRERQWFALGLAAALALLILGIWVGTRLVYIRR